MAKGIIAFSRTALCIGVLIQCNSTSAQVLSKPPKKWETATIIGIDMFSKLELDNNSPEDIRRELLNTNMLRLIAKSASLGNADLATIAIVPHDSWIDIYQLGKSTNAFEIVGNRLRAYVEARSEGHTKECLFAGLTNNTPQSLVGNPDLRILAKQLPLIPISSFKKAESGTLTNKAGEITSIVTSISTVNGREKATVVTNMPKTDEVCRWVTYTHTDGEIEWVYWVKFKADGSFDHMSGNRQDAKEDDPKYRKTIKEVEDEAHTEMKRNGTFGKFGSVHVFWHLKQEKLKAKGIKWRSPAELNPKTNYD